MFTRRLAVVALSLFALTSSACYHAIVETGRPASTEVINQPWAMSFVAGLIPPPAVNTASTCPNGVAKVETQHSFLNSLVAIVTVSIITPMQITITCASSGAVRTGSVDTTPTVRVGADATVEQKAAAVNEAARLAAEGNGTAFVQF